MPAAFMSSWINSFEIWNTRKGARAIQAANGMKGKIAFHASTGLSDGAGGIVPLDEDPRPYIVLCSIFPFPRGTPFERFGHLIGRPRFCFEAAPRGEFRSMRIIQGMASERDTSEPDVAEARRLRDVEPKAIIGDLLEDFSLSVSFGIDTSATVDRRPGFLVIKGDAPDEEEQEHLNRIQMNWFKWLVSLADAWGRSPKVEQQALIQDQHHEAVDWLGEGGDKLMHPWHRSRTVRATKDCVGCGEKMNAAAIQHSCGIDLVSFTWENLVDTSSLEGLQASVKAASENDPALARWLEGRKEKLLNGWRAEQARQAAAARPAPQEPPPAKQTQANK